MAIPGLLLGQVIKHHRGRRLVERHPPGGAGDGRGDRRGAGGDRHGDGDQHLIGNETAEMCRISWRGSFPTFPDRTFAITNYGAKGDGVTDCTKAIKEAIDACHNAGGGRVSVPAGVYLTGAIHLKSNVDLDLALGATVRFSTDPRSYLSVVLTRYEGTEVMNYSPFIYALGQENIAITGEGTLDGQGTKGIWYSWKRIPQPNQLVAVGDQGVPVRSGFSAKAITCARISYNRPGARMF